jgi:hypothetical protein
MSEIRTGEDWLATGIIVVTPHRRESVVIIKWELGRWVRFTSSQPEPVARNTVPSPGICFGGASPFCGEEIKVGVEFTAETSYYGFDLPQNVEAA